MTNYEKKVRQIVAIIDNYCTEPNLGKELPKISEIASRMYLSESTMKREFVKLRGTTIYDLYLYKKMHVAKAIIKANPEIRIGDLAVRFGYVKANNFITVFENVHGITPGKFKDRIRK